MNLKRYPRLSPAMLWLTALVEQQQVGLATIGNRLQLDPSD